MKIQFINPTLGGDYSALDISICNLATFLNHRTKHEATICDLTFHRKDWQRHIHRSIIHNKPDIIGISSNTLYMNHIKKIMMFIKENYDLPVILGGYHASIYGEQTFAIPEVDAICRGDGEFALAKYLDRHEKNQAFKGIDGIWAKQNGQIIRNKTGNFIKDIDSLPLPDWSLWKDLKKYFYFLGMGYFMGTRGCPYKCTNCDAYPISHHVNGPYYRLRNPEKYVHEIKHQWDRLGKKYGMRLAQLFDQVFTLDYKWVKRFCDEYISVGLSEELPFSTFSRFDHLNEEKIKLLSKANCKILRVGAEAGNEFIRNKIHGKGVSNNQIYSIMNLGKKYNIGFTVYFMLGGPAETKKTIQESIVMAQKIQNHKCRIAFFVYKPFTEEGIELIKKYRGVIDENRWSKADNITFGAVVRLKDVSPREVEWYQKKAYLLTFGEKWLQLVKEKKLTYFYQMSKYIFKGLRNGMDIKYLVPYFHIYGYDNIIK
ncbi:MAG: B12-binding domain-containing radical SAM protein [Nanoarchaeota archaeon]|nr:B12-binding domain-containing radical SAM protein [Nanoarchaeota archaeon]